MNRNRNFRELSNQLLSADPLTMDLHMHTIYCDGKDTPEEMILSAIRKGFQCIGFSGHSYVSFDLACGMDSAHEKAYREEILRLRDCYRDQIRILCGIEQDYYSETDPSCYDYIIGSVHYLKIPADQLSGSRTGQEDSPVLLKDPATGDSYASVDDTPEILKQTVARYYHGDYYLAAEQYFETVAQVVSKTGADIVGHFDLFSKFNEKEHLFDENHPRYTAAWQKAADRLLETGRLFEINTGAISRGWRSIPYPNPRMIHYILARGGRFLLSGDSHSKENIGFAFPECREFLS